MSYLARMLARAGIAVDPGVSAASPRLPSWFEQSDGAHEAPLEQAPAQRPGAEEAAAERTARPTPQPVAAQASPEARGSRADGSIRRAGVPATPAALFASPTAEPVVRPAPPAAGERPAQVRATTVSRPASATSPAPAARAPHTAARPLPAPGPDRADGRTVRDQPSPTPVVRVSIGRIDVRTTIAAPAAPPERVGAERPAPQAPVLSLADYLGGRREAR